MNEKPSNNLISLLRDQSLCLIFVYNIYISNFKLSDLEGFNACINNLMLLNKESHHLLKEFINLTVSKSRQKFLLYFEGRDKFYNGDVLLNNYKLNEIFSMAELPNSININENNSLANDILPLCYCSEMVSIRLQFNLIIPKWLIKKYIEHNGELDLDKELKITEFQLQKYILSFHCHHLKSGQVGQHHTQEFITSYWSYILLYFVKIKLFPFYLANADEMLLLLNNKQELEYTYDIPWIDMWQLPFEEIKHYYMKSEMDLYLRYENKYLTSHEDKLSLLSCSTAKLPRTEFVSLFKMVVIPLNEPYQIDHKVSYLSLRTLVPSHTGGLNLNQEFLSKLKSTIKSK